MIQAFGATDRGWVRPQNQDRILTDQKLGAFIVADGMGGENHGEIAAALAISTMRYYLESSQDRVDVTWPYGYNFGLSLDANRLTTGIQLANQQVWRHAKQGPEFAGMGTTIVAMLVGEEQVVIANVGDSRAYRLQGSSLTLVSFDDTFINTIAQRNDLSAVEISNHPMRNVLTQAAGTQEVLDVHSTEIPAAPGEQYLLCSDGLHSVVSDSGICAILQGSESVEAGVTSLINAALAVGGPDNISCILVSLTR